MLVTYYSRRVEAALLTMMDEIQGRIVGQVVNVDPPQ